MLKLKVENTRKERIFMKKKRYRLELTGILAAICLLWFPVTAMAAPSVEGDTSLTVTKDGNLSAEYTITSDEPMDSAQLTLSYDKEALTYTSGSGGNSFSGNGGNGTVQLSSKPGDTTTSFTVKFKGNTDGETALTIAACTIVVDGQEINVLSGDSASGEEGEEGEEAFDNNENRASFVIDERTFYEHRPEDIEGFEPTRIDIQGKDSRVLKHQSLDVYVIRLYSDNGSYRDNFVYNPDTGNVIPFVQMTSGTDTVIFIEPEEGVHAPTRYTSVNLGWGPKYTIPALKHVIIDGVDEIQDDTNRYLIYGINQDGEKAWYSFDYDKNTLQLFDDVAYQGEQNYIMELEEKELGLGTELSGQIKRYDRDMARRLYIIMFMTILIIVLLNVIVMMYLRMKKMRFSEPEETEEEPDPVPRPSAKASYITGNLEENESDFHEPGEEGGEEEEEIDLEIIDLDDLDEDD